MTTNNRKTDRLRAIGLVMAGAGWGLLLAASILRLLGVRLEAVDMVWVAAVVICLVVSGAVLLVLDALRDGFGSLDAFFQAALARSTNKAPDRTRPAGPQTVPQRGKIGDRPYTLYGDGTVAVETVLGRRFFASLDEAQEFVGA